MSLIINADDLGYSENRDAGIFDAHACRAITAASLIVNGPTAQKAAKKAKEVGLYLSLHLNLTEGKSLTGPSIITNDRNDFFYKFCFVFCHRAEALCTDYRNKGSPNGWNKTKSLKNVRLGSSMEQASSLA